MSDLIEKDTWVEIHTVVLKAGERAPQVPEDTAKVPFEMKVKGFLTVSAVLGDQVEIITAAGRLLRGRLINVNPPYQHSFGAPITELLTIGAELRSLLAQGGADNDGE